MKYVAGVVLFAACAPGTPAEGDASVTDAAWTGTDAPVAAVDAAAPADAAPPGPDARPPDAAPPAADAAPPADTGPHRHTIAIDGVNDFAAATETFATTSAGYSAYVTWDDSALYVGYSGADIDSGTATRWLLVFIDVDPGAGTGALVGEPYNTQQPEFPAGFGAEYAYRWRASNDFQDLRAWDGDAWAELPGTLPQTFQTGTYVETALARVDLGSPTELGVIALMINEQSLSEWSYAGLYADSFSDGYHAAIPITAYLRADLASTLPPNDTANRVP